MISSQDVHRLDNIPRQFYVGRKASIRLGGFMLVGE